MIGDEQENYTFYDFNDSNTPMEFSDTGKAMIPAWSFVNKIPGMKYSYNKTSEAATIYNTVNGKKLVFHKNSKLCSYYKNEAARPIEKELSAAMYISKSSKTVMVPAAALSLLMPAGGYKFIDTASMQEKGYDTYSFDGCLIYEPYTKIQSIPAATKVKGLSQTIRVTIPEGYSVPQTFELLVKKGVCTSVDLLYEACQTYDFSYYPLVAAIPPNDNRCFRLEGYLFPDTYEFYRMSSGQNAIGVFLRNIEQKITPQDKERADELRLTINDVLTIASIIEKECSIRSEQANISAVIHNRLSIGMRLQMDAGSYYVERYIKPYLSDHKDRYNSFYNTYKCDALPAGPICSPGKASIEAALYPSDISALFFCSDKDGNYYYAATFEEHQANLAVINNDVSVGTGVLE